FLAVSSRDRRANDTVPSSLSVVKKPIRVQTERSPFLARSTAILLEMTHKPANRSAQHCSSRDPARAIRLDWAIPADLPAHGTTHDLSARDERELEKRVGTV